MFRYTICSSGPMHSNIVKYFLLFGLISGSAPAVGEAGFDANADLQFFGDVMLSARSVAYTNSSAINPRLFAATAKLLGSAQHNIVNLEGVITDTLLPHEYKRFLLPMPLDSAAILRSAGIDIVTLANNHTMDFGFQGLLSTMVALSNSGLVYAGAGINAAAAAAPVIISLPGQSVCLLAFSRTLPISFWAGKHRAGTAVAAPQSVIDQVSACAKAGFYTVAAFHWGQEERSSPRLYQEELAHLAIDAGANLVIGHHPHRIQPMEVYKGRPILYSLGNFAFGSDPVQTDQGGLAVRLSLPRGSSEPIILDLIPLDVNNHVVRFIPRPASRAEVDAFEAYIPKAANCRRRHAPEGWSCLFKSGPA